MLGVEHPVFSVSNLDARASLKTAIKLKFKQSFEDTNTYGASVQSRLKSLPKFLL